MLKRYRILIILVFVIQMKSIGQETGYGPGYQLTMIGNPAVTGSEGDGYIRLSYMNLYPGNALNLHSALLTYDGYYPSLHGGIGLYFSDDYLGGIVNDLKGGVSYAYFFQADKDLYFSAGLSAAFYNRGYNFDGAVLPDQIDPLGGAILPAGELITEEGRTVLDLGTGFVFYTGSISGGLAVNHLAEPDLSRGDISTGKLKRSLFVHIAGDFDPGSGGKLTIHPLGKFELQEKYISGGAGAVIEISYLSVSSILFASSNRSMDLQAGFSFTAGMVNIFYNYRCNLLSGQSPLPFSLFHQTGVALRLNNVDKRKTVKTINFPKL